MLIKNDETKKRTMSEAGIESAEPNAKKQKTEQSKRCYLAGVRPYRAYMPICYRNCCDGCNFSCCRNCECGSQPLPLFGQYDDASNDTMSTDVFAQKSVDEIEEKEAADTMQIVMELMEPDIDETESIQIGEENKEEIKDKEESAEVLVQVKPMEIRLSPDDTVQIYEDGSVDEIRPLQADISENSLMIATSSSSISSSLSLEQIEKKKEEYLKDVVVEERDEELNGDNPLPLPLDPQSEPKQPITRISAEASYLSSPKIVENYAVVEKEENNDEDDDMAGLMLNDQPMEAVQEEKVLTMNEKAEDNSFEPIAINPFSATLSPKDGKSRNYIQVGRFEVSPNDEAVSNEITQNAENNMDQKEDDEIVSKNAKEDSETMTNHNKEQIVKDGFIQLNQSEETIKPGQYVPTPFSSFN